MSLKYFARFQFNGADLSAEDFGERDLAVETGSLSSEVDVTYGNVLALDGITSLMSIGTLDIISGAAPRSFSFWAKTDLTNCPMLSYGDLVSPDAFVIYANNDSNHPEVNDYNVSYESTYTNIISTWAHYVVTYDGATTLNIYVDGVLSVSLTITTLTTGTADPFRIGTDALGNYMTGSVSDLRIFDHEIVSETIGYMFSVGPNYEEKIDSAHTEKGSSRGYAMSGTHISNESYGVTEGGNTLSNSYFAYDSNADLQESARIEYTEDVSGGGIMDMKVRHSDTVASSTLFSTIKATPESTTFSNIDSTDTSRSVVFSSDGVSITSGDAGMFFGANKDFKISVSDGGFEVSAYSSGSGTYVTKFKVDP